MAEITEDRSYQMRAAEVELQKRAARLEAAQMDFDSALVRAFRLGVPARRFGELTGRSYSYLWSRAKRLAGEEKPT